jgi:hypothetical protein
LPFWQEWLILVAIGIQGESLIHFPGKCVLGSGVREF